MAGARSRWRRVLAVAVLLPTLWLAWPAPSASAHATLLGTTPPAGYAVPTAPGQVTLDFDEPVSITAPPLTLSTDAGVALPLGTPSLSLGERRLSAAIPERLAFAGYRVRWQITAQDGDLVSGVFTFAVGAGAAPTAQAGGGSLDPPSVIVLRWLLFLGLALAIGGTAGAELARRVAREATRDDRALPPVAPPVMAGPPWAPPPRSAWACSRSAGTWATWT